jgi:hypothetical protein
MAAGPAPAGDLRTGGHRPGAFSISDIGDAANISKSYVSRILRLALLAPDIIEAILAGKTDQALMLEELQRPLPVCWVEQRWCSGRRLVRRGSRSESA